MVNLEVCPEHEEAKIQCKTKVMSGRPHLAALNSKVLTKEQDNVGKIKVKYKEKNQVCLASKSYFCQEETNKQVFKGISIAQNPLTFDRDVNVLEISNPLQVENRSF